jgi:hypothetical protein
MTVISAHESTPARPRRQLTMAIVGSVLAVVGSLATISAIGLIAVFGSASALDSGQHQVSTSASALVTDVAHVQNTHGVGTLTGWPTLRLTASGGDAAGVFIGIGPAAAVDEYLAGVAVDQVTDLTIAPFELTTARHPGDSTATAPGEQDFWVASADSRSTADLTWTVQDGDYRLVVMNADGIPNVIAQARVQLTLPDAFQISLIVLGSGLLILTGGVVVLVGALSRGRSSARFPNASR